jgi:hypothetical protein
LDFRSFATITCLKEITDLIHFYLKSFKLGKKVFPLHTNATYSSVSSRCRFEEREPGALIFEIFEAKPKYCNSGS